MTMSIFQLVVEFVSAKPTRLKIVKNKCLDKMKEGDLEHIPPPSILFVMDLTLALTWQKTKGTSIKGFQNAVNKNNT